MVDMFELYGGCREVGYCVCGGRNFCEDPLLLAKAPRGATVSRITHYSALTIITVKRKGIDKASQVEYTQE